MKNNIKEGKNKKRQNDNGYRKHKSYDNNEKRNYYENDENSYDDIVEGRNAVLELLNSDRDINKIFVQAGEKHGSINKIIAIAKENRVVVTEVEKSKLDFMSKTNNHQGVIAVVPPFNYCEVEDILDLAKQRNEDAFVLILDGIEDPHNLGAILRTCDAVGVDGVIIAKNRSVGLNATVAKVSTGAIHHVKVAQVTNLTRTLEELKKKSFWVVGCELENSQDYRSVDYNMPTVLVIGSEGAGISRLVKKSCDINVVLPMCGHVNSLNASVAAAVLLYQVYNSRHPLS